MAFNHRDCEDADRLMQKALDGALTPLERQALDKHIAACPACAAAWEEHRALSRMATAWTRRPVTHTAGPQDFTAAVLSQIAARPQAPSGRAVSPLAFRLGIACFAAFLVAASYFLSRSIGPFWTAPQIPAFSADSAATAWSEIVQSGRDLPADALAAWNSLLSQQLSYSGVLVAAGVAASLALILGLQAMQRPRGRYQ